jgi:predicted  nucleic acid-binding Zn-ribbon protein
VTLSDILSVIAVLFAISVIVWMKVLSSRAFKSIDDKTGGLEHKCSELDASVRNIEKDIVRFEGFQKGIEKDIKQVKAEVVRETQVMNNQLESVHTKIDHLDEKFDKFRDSRGGRS